MLKYAFLPLFLIFACQPVCPLTIDQELADITPKEKPSENLRAAAAYREIYNQLKPFNKDKIAQFERRYQVNLTNYNNRQNSHDWLLKQFSWDQLLQFYDKLGIPYEKAVKTPRLDLLRIKKSRRKKMNQMIEKKSIMRTPAVPKNDNSLAITDPEIALLIDAETTRQRTTINLIASENYVSDAVQEAVASVLTNKYAEGYPGKRYYGGCQIVDQVEQLAIDRCKKLFNAEHANVQPHAGSQANMAVYFALLKPGDTILGMSLAHGGHLTHGHSVNFSGTLFKSISYGVHPETHLIDYKQVERLALEHKPKLIVAGASAYSRIIDFERFAAIAKKVGAYFMADIAHIAGLVAAGVHPNPFPYADVVTSTTHKTLRGPRGGLIMCKKELADLIDRAIIPGTQGGPFMHIIAGKAVAFELASREDFKDYQKLIVELAQTMAAEFKTLDYKIIADGTDNHLFILDLRNKNITGRDAEVALEKAGIIVSRSCIPNDPQRPWITSGIRIGTPSIATRGVSVADAIEIVHLIDAVIKNSSDDNVLNHIKKQAGLLCSYF